MARKPDGPLRTGFTTGTCATAAAAAACEGLLTGQIPDRVTVVLPKGQEASFDVEAARRGDGWAEAAIRKDAGDDPDVTHGVLVFARVEIAAAGNGVRFVAGEGVGKVTKPGLPIAPGEPAINPVPRKMITEALGGIARDHHAPGDFAVTLSIPGGREIALQTWNPRLGIEGGLSILGTTGIVRPFSCAAWIASIHRGVDVARASGLTHAIGSTGATSETVAQVHFGLPDHAMLDMGDFAGGLLKYVARHPIDRLTIAGGFGKLTKLAQGALDLHSARSQVDFAELARTAAHLGADPDAIEGCNTAQEALDRTGPELAVAIAARAQQTAKRTLGKAPVALDVMIVDRSGTLVAKTGIL